MKPQKLGTKIPRVIDTSPSECRIVTFSSLEFTSAVEKFINSNFRGLIDLEITNNAMGYIDVSARGFAHFLKMLLTEINAKAEISAKIKCSPDLVEIKVDCGDISVDFSQMIKIAEQSGFKLKKNPSGTIIELYTPIRTSSYMCIYSSGPMHIMNALIEVFFEE
ncbi:MAG: hypothetical protein IJ515_05845 [Clostridia bacterium]|nr:hypothetical protein [Clostridia bacterium]